MFTLQFFFSEASAALMPSRKDLKRLHVTFGDSKRIISLPKGEKVKDLRYHFLRSFADILSEHVAVANVKFQQFDDAFQDYTDLENDQTLEENGRVKAFIAAKYGEKESSCWKEVETGYSHFPPHIVFPWIWCKPWCKPWETFEPPDIKFHPIKKDVPYRLWNVVSNGLIQRDPDNPSIVTCSGGFGSQETNTVIEAKSYGMNLFYLVYVDPLKDSMLYITVKGEEQEIIVAPSASDAALFEPDYYWGHTMFRSKPYQNLYLGCDSNRLATLVPMTDRLYPNPQALFIVNKFNLIMPVD